MQDEIILPGIGKVKVRRGMNIRFLSVRIAPGRGVWVNVPYGVSGRPGGGVCRFATGMDQDELGEDTDLREGHGGGVRHGFRGENEVPRVESARLR